MKLSRSLLPIGCRFNKRFAYPIFPSLFPKTTASGAYTPDKARIQSQLESPLLVLCSSSSPFLSCIPLGAGGGFSAQRGVLAAGVDLPVREVDILADLVERPARVVADGGRDIAGADFLFGQVFFVHEPLFHRDGWPPRGAFGARGADVVSVASSIAQDGQLGKKMCPGVRFPARIRPCWVSQGCFALPGTPRLQWSK